MSKSAEFFNKVKNDPTLQQKVKAVKMTAKEHAVEKILKIAKDAGFDLDKKTLEETFLSSKGELSDKELETVSAAGGSRGSCSTGYTPLY